MIYRDRRLLDARRRRLRRRRRRAQTSAVDAMSERRVVRMGFLPEAQPLWSGLSETRRAGTPAPLPAEKRQMTAAEVGSRGHVDVLNFWGRMKTKGLNGGARRSAPLNPLPRRHLVKISTRSALVLSTCLLLGWSAVGARRDRP